MEKQAFASFVREKAKESERAEQVDWAARRSQWLSRLSEFYVLIDSYLADFVKAGEIKVEHSTVFINEEHIGRYSAESRIISLGNHKVNLLPVGTLLIGARGRVDMVGPAGTSKFILTGKHSNGIHVAISFGDEPPKRGRATQAQATEEYVWKLATPPPSVRFIDLTPEVFFSALTAAING